MNAFARITSAFGRWLAPVALAATVITGSLGFSNVASAQERGPAPRGEMAGPRGAARPGAVAPFARRPGWRGRYWGPGYSPRGYAWGRPGWRDGRGFRGAPRGGVHGGFHGGRGGGFRGGRR
jgi:hypothetical protein